VRSYGRRARSRHDRVRTDEGEGEGSDGMREVRGAHMRVSTMTERSIALVPSVNDTAVALIVAPEDMETAIQAVPPDQLLSLLWFLDELGKRVYRAKQAVTAEAAVALGNSELYPALEVDGAKYLFQSEHRGEWDDLEGLYMVLERLGVSAAELGAATQGARVTDLEKAAQALPENVPGNDEWHPREEALEAIKAHRVFKDGPLKLVPEINPYARPKKRVTATTAGGGNPRGDSSASE